AWKNGTVPSSSEPIWRGKYFACLDLFQRRWVSGRFHAHGEERAQKKQSRAPELGVSEALAKKNCGKPERSGRTNELQRLRKRDADLANGHVIQNVSETDARHGRNDQDNVHAGVDPQRRFDFPERNGERQKEERGDETDNSKTPNGTELRGRSFHEHAVERPAKTRGERDGET